MVQSCDVLILGGGTGGVAAAVALRHSGLKVILTEETDWLGGQLSSQAVPSDEHPWIETFGCTMHYRHYRNSVRNAYLLGSTQGTSRRSRNLNPGGGWVSNLCHDPRISARLFDYWLANSVQVMKRTMPIRIEVHQDQVVSVTLRNLQTGEESEVHPKFVLDATELGDGLALAGAEFVTGFESRQETSEPDAPEVAQPNNWQAITWVFAMAHDAGSNRVIDRPEAYDRWRSYQPSFWPGPLLGPTDVHPITLQPRNLPLFADSGLDWFRYRQIIDPSVSETEPHPVTIVNWPMNDYFIRPILTPEGDRDEDALADAKELGRCLLYYLQTEWPRPDGGTGYPGLYLSGGPTGTADGFAKFPYIRESRRARTVIQIRQQHISSKENPGRIVAERPRDSVGVGAYRIDLHPSTGGDNYLDVGSLPFHIPLGSLIPTRLKNMIPCAKNIGTTHITNGCYRLHPVEWNIGEVAGYLAANCLRSNVEPVAVWENDVRLAEFQAMIEAEGVETRWPDLRPL